MELDNSILNLPVSSFCWEVKLKQPIFSKKKKTEAALLNHPPNVEERHCFNQMGGENVGTSSTLFRSIDD